MKTILLLGKKAHAGRIAAMEGKEDWRRLAIAVDSGACDNVIGPDELPAYEAYMEETAASINGVGFVAANGEDIPNYGELKVPMITREGTGRGMVFQVAGVKKPLASVDKMYEAGHVVVFNGPESFIYNKHTGETNALRREDGNYVLDAWVPPPSVAKKQGFHGQP